MKNEQIGSNKEIFLICKAINELNGNDWLSQKNNYICILLENKMHHIQITKDMLSPFGEEILFPHEYLSLIYSINRMINDKKNKTDKEKMEALILLPRFVRNYLAQHEKSLEELKEEELNFVIKLLMSYYHTKNKKCETTINFIKQLSELDEMEEKEKQKKYSIN